MESKIIVSLLWPETEPTPTIKLESELHGSMEQLGFSFGAIANVAIHAANAHALQMESADARDRFLNGFALAMQQPAVDLAGTYQTNEGVDGHNAGPELQRKNSLQTSGSDENRAPDQ